MSCAYFKPLPGIFTCTDPTPKLPETAGQKAEVALDLGPFKFSVVEMGFTRVVYEHRGRAEKLFPDRTARKSGCQQLKSEDLKVGRVGSKNLAHTRRPEAGRELRVEDAFATE